MKHIGKTVEKNYGYDLQNNMALTVVLPNGEVPNNIMEKNFVQK